MSLPNMAPSIMPTDFLSRGGSTDHRAFAVRVRPVIASESVEKE